MVSATGSPAWQLPAASCQAPASRQLLATSASHPLPVPVGRCQLPAWQLPALGLQPASCQPLKDIPKLAHLTGYCYWSICWTQHCIGWHSQATMKKTGSVSGGSRSHCCLAVACTYSRFLIVMLLLVRYIVPGLENSIN